MTIFYDIDASFFRLMFMKWTGSVWKLTWKSGVFYFAIFYAVFIGRKFIWKDWQHFDALIDYWRSALDYYPLDFVLGFFVMFVMGRWYVQTNMVNNGCLPDTFMNVISVYLPMQDQESDGFIYNVRRRIGRWAVLLSVLAWRPISSPIMKRFPTEQHLVETSLMTKQELQIYQGLSYKHPYESWIVPGCWCQNLLNDCYKRGLVDSEQLKHMINALHSYMSSFRTLLVYNWLSVPLCFTQVATIAVHSYFFVHMVAAQPKIGPDLNNPMEPETYLPWMLIVKFFCYMGWLHVAQDLIDPYGEDDDDFEMNYILDRNYKMAQYVADHCAGEYVPDLDNMEYKFLDPKNKPYQPANIYNQVPYTMASLKSPQEVVPDGSPELDGFNLTKSQEEIVCKLGEDPPDYRQLFQRKSLVEKVQRRFSHDKE